MNARDAIAAMRGELQDLVGDAAERDDDDWYMDAANAILAAGYSKPRTIQYVVVTADGGVYDCSFGLDRQKAQEVADQATADAASVGMDYTYRVAELIEPQP